MINIILKSQDGMALVFDKKGEQIPKYQGQYREVKEIILRDAPPEAIFRHSLGNEGGLNTVSREEW